MQLTIDIPAKIEKRAAELGVDVSVLVEQAFDVIVPNPPSDGFNKLGVPRMTRSQAGEAMRELQRTQTLGPDLTIKQLIEEGRRY